MKKKIDMLHGSIWDKVLLFALPIAASAILQQLFNAADTAVVGRFASSEALAAVGSNAVVINFFITIFTGLSVGTNVICARYLGQDKGDKVKKAVSTSIMLSLFVGIGIAALGLAISPWLLEVMACPDNILSLASLYLRIYFFGMPFILIYNFGAAILRSEGDTRRPMLCLILSGIVNVLLNLIFVILFKMSVAGVALATDISNIISASLVVYFLIKEEGPTHLDLKHLTIDQEVLAEILKVGIPSGIQGMLFCGANILIQRAMNGLGSSVIAGSSAGYNIEIIAYYLLNAFGQTMTTFVSQNFGAGDYNRVKRIVRVATGMSVAVTCVACVIFVLFRHPLVSIFSKDAEVIYYGEIRLIVILALEPANALIDAFSGALRGLGKATLPALICVAGVCVVRLFWIFYIFPMNKTFYWLLMAFPVSFLITSAALFISYEVVKKQLLN